jgi:uncharacterized Fe-S cluster-containing radical SAM superfamily enzyme
MTDPIDFERSVARFGANDVAYVVDLLRNVYKIVGTAQGDPTMHEFLGDFIEALDECDSIEIVDDIELLHDEG